MLSSSSSFLHYFGLQIPVVRCRSGESLESIFFGRASARSQGPSLLIFGLFKGQLLLQNASDTTFFTCLVASWCKRKDGGGDVRFAQQVGAEEGLDMARVKGRRVLDGARVRGDGRSR